MLMSDQSSTHEGHQHSPPRGTAIVWMVKAVSMFAVALVVVACGGSSTKSTVGPTSTRSSTAAPASPAPSTIRQRLLAKNELPGFSSAGITVYASPSSWLSADQLPPAHIAAEKTMLRKNGFRGGAREDLTDGGAGGVSIVEEFKSPQAARTALGFYTVLIKTGPSSTFKGFPVHGIPGAVGLGDTHDTGVNIAFSEGPYYYLVGQVGGGAQTIAALNTAALHLYQRVGQ